MPAIVKTVGDAEARQLALIENINRQDMTYSETAKAYQALAGQGKSVAEIANLTGKSAASVQQHLDMLALPDTIQKTIDQGNLPFSLVTALGKLSPQGQHDAASRIVTDQLGVRAARQAINAIYAKESQPALFGKTTPAATTQQQNSALTQYNNAMTQFTQLLASLNQDGTMAHYASAVPSPDKEAQRLSLMQKQLKAMQTLLEQTHANRQAGVYTVPTIPSLTTPTKPTGGGRKGGGGGGKRAKKAAA